ncbi:MAG: hypothetical protein HPY45_00240 [Anaerolineae bacterium]|nr:hypothetical protein [Anaerolineae bacterium]
MRTYWSHIPDSWRSSVLAWLAGRLTLTLWGALLFWAGMTVNPRQINYYEIAPRPEGWQAALLGIWTMWDGIHYLRIAELGYFDYQLTAFFPLYPLLGRWLAKLMGVSTLAALVLLSSLAYLFALFFLYKIVEEIYSAQVARTAVFVAAFFPTVVFNFATYPISTSLLLILIACWAALKRKWFLATLAGFALALTHGSGMPLAALLAFEVFDFLRRSKGIARWMVLATPLAPFMGVTVYLGWRLARGYPPYWQVVAEFPWESATQMPWQTLMDFPNLLRSPNPLTAAVDFMLFLLALITIVWGVVGLRRSHLVYLVVFVVYMLFFVNTGEPLVGYTRYILLMFPVYVIIALWVQNPQARKICFAVMLGVNLFMSWLFFMGLFIG